VQFATHGRLSTETAQFGRAAEPALVLTPPATATDKDDGLLTASEVAQLKLNADWVVLSACNTAAGDKPGAEPLAGLASAFFYARARALLVSHWYVNSHAAAQITTRAFEALEREPSIGYAEAFRRSMLTMMDDSNWQDKKFPAAHPAIWAPFALVGEGGSFTTSATSSQMSAPPER
jgi:CHAT domain-containing protein